MTNYKITVEQVDALLPQTQCGECGYGGCLPYAKAIVNQNEAINKCPPGGVNTLIKLSTLLEQDAQHLIAGMESQQKKPTLASIREHECIGCTKCIQACPVDAILGSAKQMHDILQQECTGCGLCIPACPVDCIELISIDENRYDPEKARQRFQAKDIRKTLAQNNLLQVPNSAIPNKKSEILAAVARAKEKNKLFSKP